MKKQESFISPRLFTVFSYQMSHGILVLRSAKTTDSPHRVTIMIKDVKALELRTYIEGIAIEPSSVNEIEAEQARPNEVVEVGHNIFKVTSKSWKGYVVGGAMFVEEDTCEYFAPSDMVNRNIL